MRELVFKSTIQGNDPGYQAWLREILDVPAHKNNSEGTGYWFSAKGSVYDASTFMQKHPGGDTVIALCSGQDSIHTQSEGSRSFDKRFNSQ